MLNIFQAIANSIAKTRIKATVKDLENEPSLKASVDALKFHSKQLEKNLDSFCDRNPQSPLCKNKGTK